MKKLWREKNILYLIITDKRMKDSYLFKAATEKQGHHIIFVSLQ